MYFIISLHIVKLVSMINRAFLDLVNIVSNIKLFITIYSYRDRVMIEERA